jgi:hypothetical protein
MIALERGHPSERAVIPRWTYYFRLLIPDPLMRLIESLRHFVGSDRPRGAVMTRGAGQTLALIFESCSVPAVGTCWARPLPRVGAKRTEITFRARVSLVFGARGALPAHGAQLAVGELPAIELIIVSAFGTFSRYSCLDWAIKTSGTRVQLEIFGAWETVVACRADTATFIYVFGSIYQAELSTWTLVLNSLCAITSFRTALMYTDRTTRRA